MSRNMKILFIYTGPANQYDEEFDINKSFFHKFISKTLRFPKPLTFPILAALTPEDYTIEVIEGGVDDIDFDKKYDVVGISCTTRYANWAYKIGDEFKRRGTFVVLGGWHPSALPNEAKQHADSVVIGEAEETWPQLLKDMENGKLKPFYCPVRPVDPSIIPHLRYDIYPPGTEFGILATRGCPYGCKFCAISNMKLRNKFRMRPVNQVIEEIKELPTRVFSFQDNSFTINVEYTKQLFKAMKGLNKKFIANGNITTLGKDDELLKIAADAGCFYWFVGFESVSQESLDEVGKKANKVQDYISAVKKVHDNGMAIAGSFVLGLEHDHLDIFNKTNEFINKSEIDVPDAGVLTPFPGTPIFDKFDREGRILTKNWDKYDYIQVVYQPKHMTPEKLFDNINRLNKEWYKTSNNLKRIIKSLKHGIFPAIATTFQNFYLKFSRDEFAQVPIN